MNGDEGVAPLPPVRGSSMRSLDLEARFADLFQHPSRFPEPDPFMRIAKGYSSATVAGKYAWNGARELTGISRGRHWSLQVDTTKLYNFVGRLVKNFGYKVDGFDQRLC